LLIASLTLLLAGCSKHAVQYGQIYESHQGTNDDYYARSNSDGAFNYWMYGGGDNNFSGGQWTRVPASSVPSNLKATDKVVEEKEGEPDENVEEKSDVPENEVVTETTTSAQESESSGNESSSEAQSSSSESGTSGSSESSDSSSDSGGDSGGGDGGGGGDD
jgi:hypothetical protein